MQNCEFYPDNQSTEFYFIAVLNTWNVNTAFQLKFTWSVLLLNVVENIGIQA